MKISIKTLTVALSLFASTTAFAPVKEQFSAVEMQQISTPTPGLFDRSDAFTINFIDTKPSEYSFPLPVGKATTAKGNMLEIVTTKGDAVKAMFGGVVRLSKNFSEWGNVVVIRHNNGLETVYGRNAQNLVKVGQKVSAGQTIAIAGGDGQRVFTEFALMINGGRINPSTVIDTKSHRLRRQLLLCKKRGSYVDVSVMSREKVKEKELLAESPENITDENADLFANGNVFRLDLSKIDKKRWSYPLQGAKVISPYGGRRRHAGVDLKTKPNDDVLAAFDGVVTRSERYHGYGNCIVVKHAWGLETLYSHQSKNLVKVGDRVKAGQVIGLTGRTGRATTEHLHFETKCKGVRFNPNQLFDHTNHTLKNVKMVLTKRGKSVSVKFEK